MTDHGRPTPAYHRALSLRAYRHATALLAPVASHLLDRRLKAGKEDPDRIGERKGRPGMARPEGRLLWIHGASVGESLSVLPLIDRLTTLYPDATFLVTTGTVTSAALMAERLPDRAIHQYAPVDQPHFVRAFLDHWRPDIGLFVESELWPVMIGEAEARGLPLALVNGRLSPRSFERWSRRRGAARELLSAFAVILAQDEGNADRLSTLSGTTVKVPGNLKRAAAALPANDTSLAALDHAIGDRPVWLAASTHPGEETLVLDAHAQLSGQVPGLLTVIAPRHPNRGGEVLDLVGAAGLSARRRSDGHDPAPKDDVYVADTLGELGIFYRLSDVAFIGGSLTPVGGHNPMEPARLGCAIVTGPHVFNFQETFHSMRQRGGLALVRNERDLSASLLRLLTDPMTRQQMAAHAENWADDAASAVLDRTIEALSPVLPSRQSAA